MVRALTVSLFALLLACGSLRAQPAGLPPVERQRGRPAALEKVGFDQRLDAQVPLDLAFRDEVGRSVRLSDYFNGKPVILVLAYYRCPQLCTQVLNGLVRAMLDLPFEAGREFNVLTVSFDPREGPELANAKRNTYLERYGKPGAENGWHFLTGEEEEIHQLAESVGFHYSYDPRFDQFAHASGIMILTPTGRISRYFFDVKYSPLDLRLGLVEAGQGHIGTPIEQILLFCFHYDPAEGRYGATILNIVRVGGVLTVLALGTFIGLMLRQERRRARRAAQDATTTG
jgi:protein SCO1/2